MKTDATVLYVEDDEATRNVYEDFLKRRVRTVLSAGSGDEGMSKFITHNPDLVITDIRMPKKNGVELVNAIRSIDPNVPIIVFSAYSNEYFLKASFEGKVDAFVTKPADNDEFTQVITRLLTQKSSPKKPSQNRLKPEMPPLGAPRNDALMVVGIGSSAGGLEALSALVRNLPLKNKTAYIVAQHLSPAHKTMMVELLARETELKVKDAEDGEALESDVIYITPLNKNIEVDADDRIVLSAPTMHSFLPKPSVNQLFISLAKNQKERTVGIILSGTGSDGSLGMRAINAEGGITIVQEPGSAKYDGMPMASIAASSVDMVIEPSQIGEELVALQKFPRREVLEKYRLVQSDDALTTIYNLLFQFRKVDFSVYRKTTVGRRIERRMAALKITSLDEYVKALQENEKEVEALFHNILINVTGFFRDPDAFESLGPILNQYLDDNPDLDEIRIWIPGVSSGEEAYTVLILLTELLEKRAQKPGIRIFATDIDENALQIARKGIYYDLSIAQMDEKRIKRFFTVNENQFEVKRHLREHIVFSVHNLLSDPPYKEIDLVVCRNLLIYLNTEAQRYIMQMLHYALKKSGILFLGKSENIASYEHQFSIIDKSNKIFRSVENGRREIAFGTVKPPSHLYQKMHDPQPATPKTPLHEEVIQEAAKMLLPNILVVNEQMDIIYKKGQHDYISIPEGYVTYNLFKVVSPKLSLGLRTAISQAKQHDHIAVSPLIPMPTPEQQSRFVKLYAVPLQHQRNVYYILYFFELYHEDMPCYDTLSSEASGSNQMLELELARTKEHMQTLIEELESTNEELQSTNEELQSSNEELQSTNEELETGNEELQSTNEELQTAYAELKEMYHNNSVMKELYASLYHQYESLLENINDAVIVSTLDGVFVHINKALCKITGYGKEHILLKSWEELIIDKDSDFLEGLQNELIENGRLGPCTVHIISSHQGVKTLSIDSYLIKDSEEKLQIWSFASDITQISQIQEELALSEKKYKITFNQANIGIAHVGLSGSWISVNRYLCDFLGYSEKELLALTFQDITATEDLDKDMELVKQLLNNEIPDYKIEKRYIRKSGSLVWANLSVALVRDENGHPQYFISIIEDIDTQKRMSLQKDQSEVVFRSTQEAIMVTDANTVIISVNPAFEAITGYTSEDVVGKPSGMLKSNHHTSEFYRDMWRSIRDTGMWSGEIWNRHKNGENYPAFLNINAVRDESGNIIQYIGVLTDISILKQSQKRIHFLANHDTLTQLPNRTLFEDRLEHALEQHRRYENHLALLYVDLDRFKVVNDGLGHQIGDDVLIEISQRFKETLRDQDTIARLGGDEFAVIVEGLENPIAAGKIAQNIIDAAAKPMEIQGHTITIGASIGISIFPNDGVTLSELLRQADIAMYEAKEAGKGTYRFTSSELSTGAFEKATMEHAIRDGLDNEEFVVYYQPIVDLTTGRPVHMEALVRWKHPKLGMVSPNKFIPIAEESDLIVSITRYISSQVIKDLKTLHDTYAFNTRISLNFSSRDLEKHTLFQSINKQLKAMKLDGTSLIIELTERKFMLNDRDNFSLFNKYIGMGCQFAIDDFGTGYSNLAYLSELPLSYLKIDKSFIEKIGLDVKAVEIVKATLAIAKALGLETIAEGIETQEQYDFLLDNGCDLGQGYLMSEPLPLESIIAFLETHKGKH